jgi:hypothetical protein
MKLFTAMLCIALLLTLSACTPKKKSPALSKAKITSVKKKKEAPIVIDSLDDDIAKFIAGLVPSKHLQHEIGQPWWRTYSSSINADWMTLYKENIVPIHKWSDSIGIAAATKNQTLFYPFAGPDFLYANVFFPSARNYVLIALEPVGTLHDVETEENEYNAGYLQLLQKSIYFSTHDGFFRTKSMEKELNQVNLNGTIHLLLFYIKRCGYSITAVKPIALDSLGVVHPFDGTRLRTVTAVQIDICDSSRKNVKSVYYFSCDLTNANLKRNPQVLRFAKSLGTQSTLLKAASYLLHRPDFTIMRNYVVDNSTMILQDDSGVPFKFFTPASWKVEVFGTYSRTIDLFTHKYQPDLKAAYDTWKPKHPLPFRIGYNLAHREANMILARRIH